MNDMSKLNKHVRKAPKLFYFSSGFFMNCFVSINLWLSHIHYVCKVPFIIKKIVQELPVRDLSFFSSYSLQKS